MDGKLELDEATVRAAAAALAGSAAELEALADRVQAAVTADRARVTDVLRDWARRTASDAALLAATVDRYAARDAAGGATFLALGG